MICKGLRRLRGIEDASKWMPGMNRCWFAGRVVAGKRKYEMTVDSREAQALEDVLSGCSEGKHQALG